MSSEYITAWHSIYSLCYVLHVPQTWSITYSKIGGNSLCTLVFTAFAEKWHTEFAGIFLTKYLKVIFFNETHFFNHFIFIR